MSGEFGQEAGTQAPKRMGMVDLKVKLLGHLTTGTGNESMAHCPSALKSNIRSTTCRMRLKASINARRRRLKRLCDGICGNKSRRSCQFDNSVVSSSQPRHSPTRAILSSSLSLQSGSGPGRLNIEPICCHTSSTITYIRKQKSSKLSIISLSLG